VRDPRQAGDAVLAQAAGRSRDPLGHPTRGSVDGDPSDPAPATAWHGARLQRRRRWFQAAFFAFFLLAPALNLLRFDLTEAQLWVLGQRWSLGIAAFQRGEIGATEAAVRILLQGFVPGVALAVAFLYVAYRFGRLYCGWLCPHFSAVELLNDLLQRATGKLSLWDRVPVQQGRRTPRRPWWPVFVLMCALLGFLWATTALTYLLPPATIWGNLVHGTLTPNQARFIAIGTAVFTLEFALARHLFCRFGCAVGLFQSLAWMVNPRALEMSFDSGRSRECRSCSTPASPQGNACEDACPMRLPPRGIRRAMFTCVQCGRCNAACEVSQAPQGRAPMLQWTVDAEALRASLRRRRTPG
jgi:polyferredoxin